VERHVYDLAIVGAGIAGLAAARRAIDLGLSVVVLEATDQIGGRIRTVSRPDGSIWDAGAHWLLQPAVNPLVREAERLGVRFRRQWRAHDGYWLDGQWLSELESDAVWLDIDDAEDLARELSAADEDVAFAELIDPESGALAMIETILTQQYGEHPGRISAIDRSRYGVFEGDWPVIGGFGRFVEQLFADVPVRPGSPVSVIDWGDEPVRLDVFGDLVEARKVLVTVSTGVLLSGQVLFVPELPADKVAAISSLPMAAQDKVAFRIDPTLLDCTADSIQYTRAGDSIVIFNVLPGGQPLVVAYISGYLCRDPERQGKDALIGAVIEQFEEVYGPEVAATVSDPEAAIWGTHPYVGGAWAYPEPGALTARAVLTEPVDGRLWFAGDATSQNAAGTVHGAYESGLDAAELIAESLGLKVETPLGGDNRPI
jgi:monoamine oxidase